MECLNSYLEVYKHVCILYNRIHSEMKNVLLCTAIQLVGCTANLEKVLLNVLLCTATLYIQTLSPKHGGYGVFSYIFVYGADNLSYYSFSTIG